MQMQMQMQTRVNRPSPAESATLFPEGTLRRGNDGRMYVVAVTVAGVHRWVVPRAATGKAGKAGKAAAASPANGDAAVVHRIPIALALQVRHPFHSRCYAPHLDDADIDWRRCVELDAYPLLDAQQRGVLAEGLQHAHFHEYVREMVQFAIEAMREPTLPRFDVRIEFPAGALARSTMKKAAAPLMCSCEVVFFDLPHELDAATLRKRLHDVLEHYNASGGGYQGPSPKLARAAQQWRKEGKDIWSIKYTVDRHGKGKGKGKGSVCTMVPRSRYADIVTTKRTKDVAVYKPRTIMDKLLGRHPEVSGTVQRVVSYPSLDGQEVFSSDVTVEVHVRA